MNPASGVKLVEILLVEDNPGDVRLTREALKDSKLVNKRGFILFLLCFAF